MTKPSDYDGRGVDPVYLGFDEEQSRIVQEAVAMALEDAAKRFTGEIPYNFVAADGYSNANDIASELFYMATEYRDGRNEA